MSASVHEHQDTVLNAMPEQEHPIPKLSRGPRVDALSPGVMTPASDVFQRFSTASFTGGEMKKTRQLPGFFAFYKI